jgi:hypothetical protein
MTCHVILSSAQAAAVQDGHIAFSGSEMNHMTRSHVILSSAQAAAVQDGHIASSDSEMCQMT